MKNRNIMMQKELKTLKALSNGDKAKKAETLYAHEIARYSRNPTADFRIRGGNGGAENKRQSVTLDPQFS